MSGAHRSAGVIVAAAAVFVILAGTGPPALAKPAAAAPSGGPISRPAVPRHAGGTVIGGPGLARRGVIVNYPAHGARRLPPVAASSYVVANAESGQVLAAKDPHGWYRPASTLKVLTAITLMPVLNPRRRVMASKRAADVVPSKAGIVAGHTYTVKALFRALLLVSANDAAIALAQATGSYGRGVAMMNAEARHLRADDTVAKRPNGLDAPGQHSSAYDLALFARRALAVPALMRDERLRSSRFEQWPHHWETLYNQNAMLTSYPGDEFGKIGWTTPAKATFIGIARRHGVTLIVTIMHCKPLTEMTYAARLLNWGFAMNGKVTPIGMLARPLPAIATAPAPAPHHTRAAATPAATLPGVPVAAGAGVAALALAGAASALIVSRRRRAGSRRAR